MPMSVLGVTWSLLDAGVEVGAGLAHLRASPAFLSLPAEADSRASLQPHSGRQGAQRKRMRTVSPRALGGGSAGLSPTFQGRNQAGHQQSSGGLHQLGRVGPLRPSAWWVPGQVQAKGGDRKKEQTPHWHLRHAGDTALWQKAERTCRVCR